MKNMKMIWNRSFLVALIGYFFLFMSVTLFFIFPLFFEQFNASRTRIGWIMGVHSLLAVFMRPIFGRLIDMRGRKNISLFGIAFLIIVLPFYHLINDAGSLPLILRALTGIGWGISMTATMTICSDLAPVTRLAQSMGIIGVAGLLSAALGPLLAEEIVRHFGFGGLFNTSLLFLIMSFVCVAWTKEVIRPNHNKHFHIPESLKHVAVLSIFLIFILPVFHGTVRGAVVNFIALFGKSIPLDRVGPFFVAFSTAAILARFLLGDLSDRLGRKKVVFPSVCIISLNLFLISQVQSIWMFVLTGLIGGFGQGLIFPALSTYIIDILGKENKGFAISLYLTFFDVGMGFGSALFGWISDLYGYRWMYLIAGLMFFLAGVVFAWKAPSPERNE
ncbi:MAG: MFS transporter [Candidatus Aminicenantes bacterium]|nr:MFS transporter [Candidatus Aminicenantes bacterium]